MKIEKITHPLMAYFLIPWYLTIWESTESCVRRLFYKLADDIDNTFCCAETENGIIKGTMFAFKRGEDMVIWQMNKINAKHVELPATAWAKLKGCKRMVFYTHRNPRLFTRRHGFKLIETDKVNGIVRHKMQRSL